MGEIRIVGPGKTRGYPYPVCKKPHSMPFYYVHTSTADMHHTFKEGRSYMLCYTYQQLPGNGGLAMSTANSWAWLFKTNDVVS